MTLKSMLVALAVAVLPPVTSHADTRDSIQPKQPVITVKSFDYGKLYVHTPERTELHRVAQLWRQRKAWWTITVEGHGYIESNEEASIELGAKRAERVRDLLVRFGVDPRFIRTIGHSRAEPGRYVDVLVDTCARCAR
jgi:outer membrane protein OmpA-like peptidoglycan-associated protein